MPTNDILKSFVVGDLGVFGRLVRLGPALDAILSRHAYPPPVAHVLAETTVLATVLAGGLKYDGVFSLQTKGDGPVGLVVADVTSEGDLRAYAQYDVQRLEAVLDAHDDVEVAPVPRLLGAGFLAFTVDQGPHTDRYQGVVDLCGATLSDCARNYFAQSEQLPTSLRLAAAKTGNGAPGGWRAAAVALQRLPLAEANDEFSNDELIENWRTAEILLSSCQDQELLDFALTPDSLLFRLFHEMGVRPFDVRALRHRCRCNEDRVLGLLAAFTADEIAELSVEGVVTVTCQFCNRRYRYEPAELHRKLTARREAAP